MKDSTFNTDGTFDELLLSAGSLPETGKTDILPALEIEYNNNIYWLYLQVVKGYFKQFTKKAEPEFTINVWASSPSFPNVPMRWLDKPYGTWPCESNLDELYRKLEQVCKCFQDSYIMHDIEKTFKIRDIEFAFQPERKVNILSAATANIPAYDLEDRIYGMYQLDWMKTHGHSLNDLMKSMEEYRMESENPQEDFDSVPDLAFNWDKEAGFNGSLWVCKEEFLHAEYLDPDYINALIPAHEKALRAQWEKDTGLTLPSSEPDRKPAKRQER